MRVRKPPLSARSVAGRVVSTSLLYGTEIAQTLTYTPPRVQAKSPDGSLKYDAAGQRVWEPNSGQPQTIQVHLTPEASGQDGERPGANINEVRYEGQVVKTPEGQPLELPAGVQDFSLSVGGKPGTLRIRPVAVDQNVAARRVAGAKFKAVWSA